MKTKIYDYDALAKELGYQKLKGSQRSHGQAVYRKGRYYITPDIDSHNGGVWKMAKKPEWLLSKKLRMGTYNENLKVRIGD